MVLEHEIKLKIHTAEESVKNCQQLGASLIYPRLFEDNQILDFEDLRLKREGKLLRLRHYGQQMTVTYKGPSDANSLVKTREEIEVEVHSLEPWNILFKSLGIRPVFRYQKYRTVFGISEQKLNSKLPNETVISGRSLKIMLDETPIGNFLELEGDQDLIFIAAEKLGYEKESFILLNYRSLYLDDCQRRGIAPADMVFS